MAASQNSLQHRVPYYHAFPVCQFSKFPPHGLREYVRIRPAVRINLASKNRTVIPAKRRLHKIPKHHTTETRRPVRETFRQRIDLAGLLTDPCPEAFPPRGAVAEIFGTSRGFTAAGLSGIHTRFPFHSSPCIRSPFNLCANLQRRPAIVGQPAANPGFVPARAVR